MEISYMNLTLQQDAEPEFHNMSEKLKKLTPLKAIEARRGAKNGL